MSEPNGKEHAYFGTDFSAPDGSWQALYLKALGITGVMTILHELIVSGRECTIRIETTDGLWEIKDAFGVNGSPSAKKIVVG